MKGSLRYLLPVCLLLVGTPAAAQFSAPLGMTPPTAAGDPEVVPFPVVYVRLPRDPARPRPVMAEVGQPRRQAPGGDLVLRQANGSETVLVDVAAPQTIIDPMVSVDGLWVYYALLYDGLNPKGADIYKVHVQTRQIVQITQQEWTPNKPDQPRPVWGVFNLGPAPGPNGKLVFVTDRNGFEATNPGYAENALALQLHVLDERTGLTENIGHFNLGSVLHPAWLNDGRIMFSTLESQGIRSSHLWGVWLMRPDGQGWHSIMPAFDWHTGTADSFHFQTQVSDGRVCIEAYYNLNNMGMGPLYCMPIDGPAATGQFGPAWTGDSRNAPQRHGRHPDGRGIYVRYPFTRIGMESLTPFVAIGDDPSQPSVLNDRTSPRVGKFTHPSGAPDNHLLVVWTAGSAQATDTVAADMGIYLIKQTRAIEQPSDMRLIVNDPAYHEYWPRAVVPWERIYGSPLADLPAAAWSASIPEGAPAGEVGTADVYKRESFPRGCVQPDTVTAGQCEPGTDIDEKGMARFWNWDVQGSDAGLFQNKDIAAVRFIHLEPTPEERAGRTYYNHAREKMQIIGEIPIRKFRPDGTQPEDPNGNPDTSFRVRIPADIAFMFDLIDSQGRTLTRSQTWHQIRPGETRVNCGGCHAHSQAPTDYSLTLAAQPDYQPFDLTQHRYPLLTSKANDELGRRWNTEDSIGVRFVAKPESPEWYRDIKPLLLRTGMFAKTTDPNLKGIDPADETLVDAYSGTAPSFHLKLPRGYAQIAVDADGKLHPARPSHRSGYRNKGMQTAMSRLIRAFQSRRSPLIWALYGARLDGIDNDDLPYQANPGDSASWRFLGKPLVPNGDQMELSHIAYLGEGIPAEGFTDDERMLLNRWVDLGCPIELRPGGWHDDTQRPSLSIVPSGGPLGLTKITIGLHDLDSGLNLRTLTVTASAALEGRAAGRELREKFIPARDGRWVWTLNPAVGADREIRLTVAIADYAGNTTTKTVALSTLASESPRTATRHRGR